MRDDESGQTLVEVLVALATAVIIVSAIVVVVLSSLNNAQFSKNQNLATQFSQEGIEIVNKLAQSNWSSFSALSGAYCLDQGQTTLGSADSKNSSITAGCAKTGSVNNQNVYPFAREVDIIPPGGANTTYCSSSCNNTTTACAIVSWSDSKCTATPYCHQVKLTSCLSNNSGSGAP